LKKNFDRTIGIVGLGYIGLPLALEASKKGWSVIGLDSDSNKVKELRRGISHIEGIQSEELLTTQKLFDLNFTDKPTDLKAVDICIICVPTPLLASKEIDLSFLIKAVESFSKILKSSCVIVNESTSYPGTLNNVIKLIVQQLRNDFGDIAGYVSAPERIDPGNKNYDLTNTPRILGSDDFIQLERVKLFYESLGAEIHTVNSAETAEFAKLIENTFRLVNISFVNELVPYASKLGINLLDALTAAATKPYGFMKFLPGTGVGGHCIAVDPYYLLKSARDAGLDLPIVTQSLDINSRISSQIINTVVKLLGSKVEEKNVLILGVAYKPGVKDFRESPSEIIARKLQELKINIFWDDPLVDSWPFADKFNNQPVDLCIATQSSTFEQVKKFSKIYKILDCRGDYDSLPNTVSYFKINNS
jgi:UDP-N-acetyl-D-glucosamine dehydrogenase